MTVAGRLQLISICIREGHTEILLAAATFLDNLNKSGFQLFNRRNVVGKNTHFSRFGGNINLYTIRIILEGPTARWRSKFGEGSYTSVDL